MINIYTTIAEREGKDTEISSITYYKEFVFDSARFIDNDIFTLIISINDFLSFF